MMDRSARSLTGWLTLLGLVVATADAGTNKLGAIGDSLTDEYAEETYSYAQSWVEQLSIYRGVDAGPTAARAGQPGGTWGEPRRTGYEFNWARSGATSGSLLTGGQHTGLAGQVGPQGLDYAVLAIGSNDFIPTGTAYFSIYNGFWSQAQIDSYVDQTVANIESAVTTVQGAGVDLALVNLLDYGIAPAVWGSIFFSNPDNRQQVTVVIEEVNARLEDLARDHRIVLVDAYGFARAVFGTNHDPEEFLILGNVAIQLRVADTAANTNAAAGFVDDGAHPHTHLQAVIANIVLEGLNLGYGAAIPLFSEQEILAHAGLVYGGQDTLQSQIGAYGDYVLDFTCPTDVTGDGVINVLDLIDLLLCFGQPAVPGCEPQDVNADGTVNVLDLIEVLLAFGQPCP